MSKLEKFIDTLKDHRTVNRGGYHRCTICNSVSNEDIETSIGDYRPGMSFTPDPIHKDSYICIECADVIQDQRFDYEYQDQFEDE
ncbi:hypothetical protein EVB79_049 [Rhizobium phage RHph_N3_13]|nr:hypothetical protein EVB79_049 [Rhizobium phage RHph_N3_13]QIG69875.1 hypothetical protein F67_I3_11_049 [Rhizobium phage RHph_I3_11]QIG73040.1 hypothetical protein EVB99_049 [Rhizobium phage RHph_N3_19]